MSLPAQRTRFTLFDLALAAVLAGVGVYFAYRIRVGLDYHWNWSVIPQYLLRYDPQEGGWRAGLITQGLFTTLRLSFWATLLATIIGTAIGVMRITKGLFLRMCGRSFVELIRNMPPLVLIFIFYFFVSDQIMPVLGLEEFIRSRSQETQDFLHLLFGPPPLIPPFLSALVTLALYEAAYIAEIVRAGIESIERGQWEASRALGMSWLQQMRHIIMPQALARILPPLAGQFISAIKDSAIVSIISIQELTFQGMELMSATYLTFEVWLTVAGLYLLLCLACSLAVGKLDSWMNRSRV